MKKYEWRRTLLGSGVRVAGATGAVISIDNMAKEGFTTENVGSWALCYTIFLLGFALDLHKKK